jgi:hypothetical protein
MKRRAAAAAALAANGGFPTPSSDDSLGRVDLMCDLGGADGTSIARDALGATVSSQSPAAAAAAAAGASVGASVVTVGRLIYASASLQRTLGLSRGEKDFAAALQVP